MIRTDAVVEPERFVSVSEFQISLFVIVNALAIYDFISSWLSAKYLCKCFGRACLIKLDTRWPFKPCPSETANNL